MRNIYITCSIWLFTVIPCFAGTLELSTDNTSPDIGEIFTLELQVHFDSLEPISDITIRGIEQFEIFSQMQSEQTQIINDDIQKTTFITLQLKPIDFGTYTIGPASGVFSGATVTSDSLVVEVGQKPIIQEEKPQEFQDIKGLREPSTKIPVLGILLTVFIGIFYYLMYVLFFSGNVKKKKIPIEKPVEKVSWNLELRKLKRDIPHLKKSEFYEKLHYIVRKYLGETYHIKNADTLTLKELKPILKDQKELLTLFKKSYTKEFDEKRDTEKNRIEIISQYLKHIL